MTSLKVEELQFDASGAPYSERYGDVYASRDGALGQARHVFLAGNALPDRWGGRDQFVIVETGFGLGVNFLTAWQAWRDDPRRPRRLHYVSLERHPLPAQDLLNHAPEALKPLAARLSQCWPPPLAGLHRRSFESGAITLTLGFGDARQLVPDLVLGADAFFLDGFAPSRNPELWEPPLLKALARLARPQASLATWSSARLVREALSAAGFELELRPGFGAKRDMLAGRFAPRFRTRRHEPPAPHHGERRAVVIGAGLAGCAAAHALARRGWDITLMDRSGSVAAGASALPGGLLHPIPAADDNQAARLMRAGFLFGRQLLDQWAAQNGNAAAVHAPTGVLQLIDGRRGGPDWAQLTRQQAWPSETMRWVDAEQATELLGLAPGGDGLWFPGGAVVSAARWCQAMVADQPAIRLRANVEVQRLTPAQGGWCIDAQEGGAQAAPMVTPILIVATALQTSRLLRSRFAPVQPIHGLITRLASGDCGTLRAGIAGNGYLVPDLEGRVSVGATYEVVQPGLPPMPPAVAHQANLERLSRLLRDMPACSVDGAFEGTRCVSRDRMPMAGSVPDEVLALQQAQALRGAHPADLPRLGGLYASYALGSRGLALAPLLGETIACMAEGEPLPIERSLLDSIDPARFLLKKLRRM